MKTISIDGPVSADVVNEVVEVLRSGGLVCFPCNGSYRIIADLWNTDAVVFLVQSKRRVKKKPSLVFLSDRSQLGQVTENVDSLNFKLMSKFWPGPLTLLLDPHPDLPRKVSKELSKANGALGVRIPINPLARRIVSSFGGPILVSSANRNSKVGECSTEQVKKNFSSNLSLFLDGGDFQQGFKSSVVEVEKGIARVIREGLITKEMVVQLLGEELVR